VANVSYELRTPLTSIKGYTETLLATDEPDRETLSSFLPIILKNTNHMVKMVDDLLLLARLDTGKTPIKISTLNASDFLMAAWRACVPLAQSKTVSLINELPEEGVFVSGDFDQMVQVFRNLLENSIRHSPDGASLTVGSLVQGDTVRFSIKDQGPGIPKHYQQRIFERFFRIERRGGTESGATGLGLAICRHIVKNHGGSIWVQSPNPGKLRGPPSISPSTRQIRTMERHGNRPHDNTNHRAFHASIPAAVFTGRCPRIKCEFSQDLASFLPDC